MYPDDEVSPSSLFNDTGIVYTGVFRFERARTIPPIVKNFANLIVIQQGT